MKQASGSRAFPLTLKGYGVPYIPLIDTCYFEAAFVLKKTFLMGFIVVYQKGFQIYCSLASFIIFLFLLNDVFDALSFVKIH